MRFIDAGEMDAPVAFGRMPVVAAAVANTGTDVLMTGVFGRAHFQIGWFEDVDAVLDLDAARAEHVDVFRRPVWGGGTAFYDTRASALFAFFFHPDRHASLDAALEDQRPNFVRTLEKLDLGDARFEGSSDIRWHDRKLGTLITQSVLGTTVVGGFLNLRKPDLDLYRRVAQVPKEKFADKVIKDMVAYICTPADVRGSDVTYEELRDTVAEGLTPESFTAEEEANTQSFVEAVGADDWVRRISSVRFREQAPRGSRVGFANFKARKLVRAGVALDGDVIRGAMLAGDMHVSPPDAVDKLAAAVPGDPQGVKDRLVPLFAGIEQADAAAGITPEDVARTVMLATEAAR